MFVLRDGLVTNSRKRPPNLNFVKAYSVTFLFSLLITNHIYSAIGFDKRGRIMEANFNPGQAQISCFPSVVPGCLGRLSYLEQ
jgi:hypothetical protein